jgi:hypothetical protein
VGTLEELAGSPVFKSPSDAPASSRATLGELRRVAELLPHPFLVKYTRGYTTQELSTLSERGEAAFADPVTITHENVIVEGYAIWQLAKLKRRDSLICVVRPMNQEDALLYLLQRNRGSKGINDYVRILMALELESWFQERAKSNQRLGGREKGSSHLAEADRLDVRIEVARAADVSAGNVSKVKQILHSAIPAIRDAVATGDITINRAHAWAKLSSTAQVRRLSDFRNENGIRRAIAVLLKRHEKRHPALCEGLRDLLQGLRKLHADPVVSILTADLLALVNAIDRLLSANEVDRAA